MSRSRRRSGTAGRCSTPSRPRFSPRSMSTKKTCRSTSHSVIAGGQSSVADVFLSYAHEDAGVAQMLAYLFEREDWSCWWDPQIALGEDFRPIVGKQIDEAVVVVVLWSGAARTSTWVRWEVDRARDASKLAELVLAEPGEHLPSIVMVHLQSRATLTSPRSATTSLGSWAHEVTSSGAATAGTRSCRRRRGGVARPSGRSSRGRSSRPIRTTRESFGVSDGLARQRSSTGRQSAMRGSSGTRTQLSRSAGSSSRNHATRSGCQNPIARRNAAGNRSPCRSTSM